MLAVKLDAPELVRPVGVVHRRKKRLNRASQAFVELLLEQPAAKEEAELEPLPAIEVPAPPTRLRRSG